MDRYVDTLTRTFAATPDKRLAHERSASILQAIAADPSAMREGFRRHLLVDDGLSRCNYPVVAVMLASTPHFELVANCWIPLPNRSTDMSTKAIHHHGTMLLTTVTAFGPGYEHWTFTHPELVDPDRDLFSMRTLDRGPHGLGDAAFVDAQIAHVPLYTSDTTITLALWSSSEPTSWKDRVKRVPVMKRNSARLTKAAARAGLAKTLDLKVVEYFDFHPSADGFVGMRERKEFPLGPNADYLASLFHVLQVTGNDGLGPVIEEVAAKRQIGDRATLEQLVTDLKRGEPIEPRLSAGHTGVPYANFTRDGIERALAVAGPLSR